MSSALSFGAFLNGAVSGFETGMDLADKYGRYKERKRDREDRAATQDAIKNAGEQRLRNQVAASGRESVVKPVVTTPAKPAAFAANIGAGGYMPTSNPPGTTASAGGSTPAARVGVMPGRQLQRFPEYRR